MNGYILAEYRRLRSKGWNGREALRTARVWYRFSDLENEGLVKLELEPEYDAFDEGDMFNPQVNSNISPKRLEQEKKELYDRIDRDGYWIVDTYWRLSEDDAWERADSCGGFIGDDWRDSGYDTDLKLSAIEAYDLAVEKQNAAIAESLMDRATYAGTCYHG